MLSRASIAIGRNVCKRDALKAAGRTNAFKSVEERCRTFHFQQNARHLSSTTVKITHSSSSQHNNNNNNTTEAKEENKWKSCGSKNGISEDDKWKLPPPEAEQRMTELQQYTRQHYKHANYSAALETAQEMLASCELHFGTEHPATASAHNDVGLMHKALGEWEESRSSYHKALRLYAMIVGKDHASYAAALNNLGNLDRAMASASPDDAPDGDDEDGGNEGAKSKPLSALERLQLNESAIDYFEESYDIRRVELGPHHPHTITSRTNLGSALAAVLLQQQASLLAAARQQSSDDTTNNNNETTKSNVLKALSQPSKFTQKRWDEAQRHLREALKAAVENPRGEVANVKAATSIQTAMAKNDNNPKGKDRSKSKKQRRLDAKKQKKQTAAQPSSSSSSLSLPSFSVISSIQTLSAASAAQNLAVFLKLQSQVKSETSKTLTSATTATTTTAATGKTDYNDEYAEAHALYTQALNVRMKLLPQHHPDVLATKFSLAELLDLLGDETSANRFRQEILDVYQVEERDGDGVEEKEQ